MTPIDFLLFIFEEQGERPALIWNNHPATYSELLRRIDHWRRSLEAPPGSVVALEGDYSPESVTLLLALIERRCIVVLLTRVMRAKRDEFLHVAQAEILIEVDARDEVTFRRMPCVARHEMYDRLRQTEHPGLVLFSSGSTGMSKGIVHDFASVLEKYHTRRRAWRTIPFLLFDHIGGVNTLFSVLSSGGCLVTVPDRTPDSVLAAVEQHRVELLPVSPTFINLVMIGEAHRRYDLSSLEVISYGTEPMAESTLKRFHDVVPHARLHQTYGLSEIGILRSKSKASDSLWVQVGGEGFETRVVNGILQIRARSAMLGYLNAPSPFTPDGWLDTGDAVEVDGDYVRILGRTNEMINVGGRKVCPTDLESVIQQMPEVAEVTVYGEPNPIVGSIVCAKVRLIRDEEGKTFAPRLKKFVAERMQGYYVPVKVVVTNEKQYGERFKKVRQVHER